MQVSEALHRYGRGLGRAGAADLRRAADRPPAARARARRGRRRRHPRPRHRPHQPRHPRPGPRSPSSCWTRPTRCSTWASPRTSRRSSAATPEARADRAVLGHHADPDQRDRPPPPARPGAHRDRAGGAVVRAGAAGPPDRVRRRAGAQGGRARAGAGRRVADRGDRVLPHPRAGRRAHRDPERPRLPGRGAARRDEPGAARPGDGPAARADRGPAGRHRRRRPRPGHRPPDARRQLRGAGRRRVLRAPDRPGRARRPRGRGDHAGRAARAPDAQDHRAGHPPEASRWRRCRPPRTCAPAGSSSPAPRSTRACWRTTSTGSGSSSRR